MAVCAKGPQGQATLNPDVKVEDLKDGSLHSRMFPNEQLKCTNWKQQIGPTLIWIQVGSDNNKLARARVTQQRMSCMTISQVPNNPTTGTCGSDQDKHK